MPMTALATPWHRRRTALSCWAAPPSVSPRPAAQVPSQSNPASSSRHPTRRREMLQNQPDMVRAAPRKRLQESGLTDDQVRAPAPGRGLPGEHARSVPPGRRHDHGGAGRARARSTPCARSASCPPQEADSLQAERLPLRRCRTRFGRCSTRSGCVHLDSLRADSLADSLEAIRPGGLKLFGIADLPALHHPVPAVRMTGPVDDELSARPRRRAGADPHR